MSSASAEAAREGAKMDAGYVSALPGSAIGALASLATTWMTQHSQLRATRRLQDRARREALYGEFIREASGLFADAFEHGLDDPASLPRKAQDAKERWSVPRHASPQSGRILGRTSKAIPTEPQGCRKASRPAPQASSANDDPKAIVDPKGGPA